MEMTAHTPAALFRIISIPPHAREWRIDDLPMSVRLAYALHSLGAETLGAIDGLPSSSLLSRGNCGAATIRDSQQLLRKIETGRIAGRKLTLDSPGCVLKLVRMIDEAMDQASQRDREILLLRLGENHETNTEKKEGLTLQQIGDRLGLTKECVRLIVGKLARHIYKSCGPHGQALIDEIVQSWTKLTFQTSRPELFSGWLKNNYPAGNGNSLQEQNYSRYSPGFYVRLIAYLSPERKQ